MRSSAPGPFGRAADQLSGGQIALIYESSTALFCTFIMFLLMIVLCLRTLWYSWSPGNENDAKKEFT